MPPAAFRQTSALGMEATKQQAAQSVAGNQPTSTSPSLPVPSSSSAAAAAVHEKHGVVRGSSTLRHLVTGLQQDDLLGLGSSHRQSSSVSSAVVQADAWHVPPPRRGSTLTTIKDPVNALAPAEAQASKGLSTPNRQGGRMVSSLVEAIAHGSHAANLPEGVLAWTQAPASGSNSSGIPESIRDESGLSGTVSYGASEKASALSGPLHGRLRGVHRSASFKVLGSRTASMTGTGQAAQGSGCGPVAGLSGHGRSVLGSVSKTGVGTGGHSVTAAAWGSAAGSATARGSPMHAGVVVKQITPLQEP